VFDLTFPVNPSVVLGNIQLGRLPADPECDLGQMLIILDFRTFFYTEVSGITVLTVLTVLTQKPFFQYDARNRLLFVLFDAFLGNIYSCLMQNIEK
jgi:hypothetical protein